MYASQCMKQGFRMKILDIGDPASGIFSTKETWVLTQAIYDAISDIEDVYDMTQAMIDTQPACDKDAVIRLRNDLVEKMTNRRLEAYRKLYLVIQRARRSKIAKECKMATQVGSAVNITNKKAARAVVINEVVDEMEKLYANIVEREAAATQDLKP